MVLIILYAAGLLASTAVFLALTFLVEKVIQSRCDFTFGTRNFQKESVNSCRNSELQTSNHGDFCQHVLQDQLLFR